MLINKSKYINKYVFCPMSVTKPLNEFEEYLDKKIEALNVDIDLEDEEEQSDELFGGFPWDDITVLEDKKTNNKKDNTELQITLEQGNILEHNFREAVIKRFNLDHINLKDIRNVHEAEKATREAINNNVGIIFEATFIYNNGEHEAVARVDAYIPSKGLIIEFKGTSSSKIKYYFDIGYQYKVLTACGIDVVECELSLIDYVVNKAGNVSIAFTNKCHAGKTGKDVGKKEKEENDINGIRQLKREYKQGKHCAHSIIEVIKDPWKFLTIGTRQAKELKPGQELFMTFMSGDFNLDIMDIANLKEPNYTMSIEACANPVATCPFLGKCKAINKYENKWLDYSGNFIPLKIALDENEVEGYFTDLKGKGDAKKTEMINAVLNETNVILEDEIIEEFINPIKNNKIVWFDFETINPAISVVDNTLPFSQQLFQNSFIKWDENGNEIERENQIVDTKNINVEWFKLIIDSLYWEGAKYVVWNKSFENKRLEEMAFMINDDRYTNKVHHIIDNVIDLADPFTVYGKCSVGLTKILIGKLHGFYSIKKVEKYVSENNLAMKDIITPYKDLSVSNGGMALMKGIARFFNLTNDDDWKQDEEDLKKYCENDVLCMVMAYEFLRYMCNEK